MLFPCLKHFQLFLEKKLGTISDEELVTSEKRQRQLMNDHLRIEEKSVESNER